MRKILSIIMILVQIFIVTSVVSEGSTSLTKYDLYYSQYVDSREPLSVLQEKDSNSWKSADESHPIMSDIPSENRQDYFNIPYGPDAANKLDISHIKGDKLRPVIFFIHGGGWTWFDKGQSRYAGPTWVEQGYTVVSVDYRLAPDNPHPAQIDDCSRALKWVTDNIQNYGGDPNRIAIIGQSAGGHLTALLATGSEWQKKYNIDMSKVKCWIPISGIHDFSIEGNFWHPWMEMFTNALFNNIQDLDKSKYDASPINHITGKESPCLIVHGSDDWLVPKTNSIVLYDKLKKKGVNVQLEIVKGYWHCNTLVNYGEIVDKPTKIVNKFLAKHLPTPENNLLKYYIDYLIKKFKN